MWNEAMPIPDHKRQRRQWKYDKSCLYLPLSRFCHIDVLKFSSYLKQDHIALGEWLNSRVEDFLWFRILFTKCMLFFVSSTFSVLPHLLGCSVWNFVLKNGLPVGPTSLLYVCLKFAATFRLLQIFSFLSILLACLFLLKRWDCKIILFLCSLLPTDMASQGLLGSTSLWQSIFCVCTLVEY